jgi:hypothetical protein
MAPAFYNKRRLSGNYNSGDVAAWGPEVARSSTTGVIGYEPEKVTYNYVLTRESAELGSADTLEGSIDASNNSRRAASLDDLKGQIERENEAVAALNERIHSALVHATNENPMQGDVNAPDKRDRVNPRRWWDWWQAKTQANCYVAAGVEAWTQTGLRPMEGILPGDRVLTRDPTTRQLTFALVTAVDEQPEGAMLELETGSRTIVVSPEQLFHVAADGWKPASAINVGDKIDWLSGTHRVERVEPSHAVARYALLVGDGSSFFVDEQGILVHDASRP